ncbi:MAG: hypothetical protein F4138_08330 [Acidimicrobiia bacterium]|nr:hypothetical protein [Acidimicrobiia bacterium]
MRYVPGLGHGDYYGRMHLKEVLEKIRGSASPENEEAAKFQVIAPILQALGWDTFDGEQVKFEYSVGGRNGGRVDIALKSRDRVVALVEAKAPTTDLNSHVAQVLGYAFHEGVDICVLTTGMEWWLYLPREPGEPRKRRFAQLMVEQASLEQLVEDFECFLGKQNLVRGGSLRQARRVLKAGHEADRLKTEMPKIWKRMLDTADDELVELISKRVYEKTSIRPSSTQVAGLLRSQQVQLATPVEARRASFTATPAMKADEQAPLRSTKVPTVKPVAIVLWGQRHSVTTHKEVLCVVAEKLFERHAGEFYKLLELKGRRHPFVARNRQALGQPEVSYEVASSGYWVDIHASAKAIRKRADRFLGCFGYPPFDLEVILDS